MPESNDHDSVQLEVDLVELKFHNARVSVAPVKVTVPRQVLEDIKQQLKDKGEWYDQHSFEDICLVLPKE